VDWSACDGFFKVRLTLDLPLESRTVIYAPPAHNAENICRSIPRDLTGLHSLYTVPAMASRKPKAASSPVTGGGVVIDRTADVLTFILDNSGQGNEVTGAMFDAMLTELRKEASKPRARVLRIRARGGVFCTGRERAGRTAAAIRRESARLIKFKAALRSSPLISVAEVQGNAFGFGLGLAIVCDFALVAEHASLAFPEMRSGLAPVAILAYLGEYALPRFAFPLVLFGEPIDPHRAQQIGLISQVCPADRLSAEADALIERVLRLDPSAVRRCKKFFLNAQQNSFDQNCRLAVDALTKGSLALLARKK
jgi:methylglutaconyl-CoA hydratase